MAIGLAASIDLLAYQMFHLCVMVSYWSLLHIPKAPFVQITHQCIHMHQSRGPDAVQCLAHETTYVHSCTGLHLDTQTMQQAHNINN